MFAAVSFALHAMLQGDLLEKLHGAPHVVKLLARGCYTHAGMTSYAILVAPVVEDLSHSSDLKLVAQVMVMHFACTAVVVNVLLWG